MFWELQSEIFGDGNPESQQALVLAAFGEKTVTPVLLERLADILVADIEERDRPLPRYGEPLPKIEYAVTGDALETARLYLVLWAASCPGAAARYGRTIATFASSLAVQAHEHEQSTIWRTSSKPPLRELGALRERLGDVACILHEMAYDDDQSSIRGMVKVARKGNLGKAIRAAARLCRSRADQRFGKRLQALENALKDNGWNARCCSRPIDEADSVYWPAREVALLVEITDFETDAGYIEDSIAMGQDHFGNDWRFRVVPVISDYVVPAFAR